MNLRAQSLTWSLKHSKILTTTSNLLTEELVDKSLKSDENDAL